MDFEPEYFNGILKAVILTLFISILPIYLTDNWTLIVGFALIGFFAVLFLNNKKWIRKVKLNFEKKKINIKYPFNLVGIKEQEINFSEIDTVTYFEYMSRTPAHIKINYSGKKLRFNCNGIESERISALLKKMALKRIFIIKKMLSIDKMLSAKKVIV